MAAVLDFDKINFTDFDSWVFAPFDMLTFKDFDNDKIFTDFDKEAMKYYLAMEISKKKQQDRVRVAQQLYEVVVVFFTYIEEAKKRNMYDGGYALEYFREKVKPIVEQETKIVEEIPKKEEHKEYIDKYINDMTDDILYATLIGVGAYWLSKKRASVIALNEANTIRNYGDLLEAIHAGYTRKQWLTMKDDKVRTDHDIVDDVIKPINGYFEVGSDLMLYPHDYINGSAEQIVNCRCALKYLR